MKTTEGNRGSRPLVALIVLCLLASTGPVVYARESEPLAPSEALLASLPCDPGNRISGWESVRPGAAVVGRVHYQVGNIFDPTRPGEDRMVFQIVNHAHRTTRPWVVEEALLFREGDPLERRVVEETERRLRSMAYLYDATIVPVCQVGSRVDLLVLTRDVWTLGIKASFKREGAVNTFTGGVTDDNFLGTGRPVSLFYVSDPDRDAYQFRFFDPSLFGRNSELRVLFEQRSDGHRHTLDLGQPFYSLDTRRSLTSRLVTDRRTERLWDAGEVYQEFDHRNRYASARWGFSSGYRDKGARRWYVGYTYQEDRFELLPESADPEVPEDRTLSYPWVAVEWIEDGYVEARHLDRIGRTEDVNLGTFAGLQLGLSAEALGGDRDRAVFDTWLGTGWTPTDRQMLLLRSGVDGRWGEEGEENVLAHLGLHFYWRNLGIHQLYAGLRLDAGWALDGERQLVLGGDSGLRGYVRNIQVGDRKALVTVEQRFYSDWEIWGLVNVGGAVFVDAGTAFWADDPASPELLSNIGVGLRLGSSRSAKGAMVHLDIAYPLNGDSEGVQFLIRSRDTF
jgi:hypothetical protein